MPEVRNGGPAGRDRPDHEQARRNTGPSGGRVSTFAGLARDVLARRAPHWRDARTERAYRQLLDD
ncbi:MAG: hypothetical protein F4Y02_16675 [Chloroflexi bacterium]|nr:hypothetical protein [Chloroflexota bacterium]